LIRAAGGVGIGTNSPYEMLVVGDDLSRPFSGNRITIGNDSGLCGINLGEAVTSELSFYGKTSMTIWS
jgi:hypothetical protein